MTAWTTLVGDHDDDTRMIVLVSDERAIDAMIARHRDPHPDISIRVIRGMRTQTDTALFQEWAAALQFPYYFGHNWDAFEECIDDLEWIPAAKHLIFITHADNVLRHDDAAFSVFTRILAQTTNNWSKRGGWWRVALQCDPQNVDYLQHRLASAETRVKLIRL